MRLLLDVHFSPVIAAQLGECGHDVLAADTAADDAVARRLSDEALLEHAVDKASALLRTTQGTSCRSRGSGRARGGTTSASS